jgi:hypothetical protein
MTTPSLPTVGGSANSWGTQLNAWLLAAHNADGSAAQVNGISDVINVKDPKYGAIGNGIHDDTAAINAAIAAATGAANPATTIRAPIAPVYLPTGIYKVTADLNIVSTQGFTFFGDGQQSRLMPSGTGFTKACLFINGAANGVFRDFYIQGDTTEQMQDAIRLDYVAASSARSTTGNKFENIWIKATNAITYFSLAGNASAQVDGTVLVNVNLSGAQYPGNWASTGNSVNGFVFGNGTFANNYDHVGLGIDAAGFYYGYKINASSLSLDGAQPANNFSDFYMNPGSQCSIRNVQSQSCNQFLTTVSGFTPVPVSFEDVEIKTGNLNSGNVIANIYGGIWHFKNFNATNVQNTVNGGYVLGTFVITGSASNRPGVVTFDNLSAGGARTSCIVPTANQAQISVRNYVNYTVSTGVYVTPVAGDLLSVYTGAAWVNLDTNPALFAPLTNAGLLGGPTAPTQTAGDNSTKLATTQFVSTAVSGVGGGSGSLQPSDLGVIGWTVNPALAATTATYVAATYAGRLLFWTFKTPAAGNINNINYIVSIAGAGLTNAFLGIYSMAGVLLGSCSTDQSTNMMTAAVRAAALSTPLAVTVGTLYRVGLVIGAMTTCPTFAAAGSVSAGANTNLGLTSANLLSGFYNVAGSYTALPTPITPSGAGALSNLPAFVMS